MKRTTVMLPEELEARLRFEARRRGVSIAEVVREAVELHLPGPGVRRRLAFFAAGEAGPFGESERTDDASRVDEIVRDAIVREYERQVADR